MKHFLILLVAFTLFVLPVSATNSTGTTTGKDVPPPHVAEMKERADAILEKWNSLSDKQKSSVYDIQKHIDKYTIKMIEKYEDLELITSDEAEQIINNLNEHAKSRTEEGKLPGIRVFPGPRNDVGAPQTTPSSSK